MIDFLRRLHHRLPQSPSTNFQLHNSQADFWPTVCYLERPATLADVPRFAPLFPPYWLCLALTDRQPAIYILGSRIVSVFIEQDTLYCLVSGIIPADF